MAPRGTAAGAGRSQGGGFRPRQDLGRREPDILHGVRARLATGEPLDLLAEVSSLVSAVDPRCQTPFARARVEASRRTGSGGRPPGPGAEPELPSLDELVRSFIDVDRFETAALLAGIAAMAPDELVRARARRAVAERAHALPPWLAGLGGARVGRTMEMVHVLGDGDDLLLEVELPGGLPGGSRAGGAGHRLTLVVYVDHNLGTVVKDAFAVPVPVTDLVEVMRAHAETALDTTWRPLDPADARARITEAVDHGALLYPPLESDTWPACRPMVEWVARLLPPGGRGYVRPEWDEQAKEALTEAFFASPMAKALRNPQARELFEPILWFATEYGPGDPLRWSEVAVEILLTDWVPRKIAAPAAFLRGLPDVLRAFVAYAHAERGIRRELTAETLEAVDRCEPEYQEAIGAPQPQGPAALLAALGAIDPNGPWDLPGWPEDADEIPDLTDLTDSTGFTDSTDLTDLTDLTGGGAGGDPAEIMLGYLRAEVGGSQALDTLDDRPLPDEPLAWDGIPPDVVPKVREVLAACDRCCDAVLDVEYRTACRRYLARVASAAPQVFRRRGRADTAAAAVCWTVGKANELFSRHPGGMRVKDLLGHFGLAQGSVSQRAATMLQAAGIAEGTFLSWDIVLGDPALLVSGHRRRIMARRDAWRAHRGD